MNDTPDIHDPLEAELLSMRPAELPSDVFDRVGRRLSANAQRPPMHLWLGGAIAAAACVLAGASLAWRVIGTPVPVVPPVAVTTHASAPVDENEDNRPALLNYRRRISRSSADLDALLDRQAARSLAGSVRITAASDIGLVR